MTNHCTTIIDSSTTSSCCHSLLKDRSQQKYFKPTGANSGSNRAEGNAAQSATTCKNGRHHPYLTGFPFPTKCQQVCWCKLHHHVHSHSSHHLRWGNNNNQCIPTSGTSRVVRWHQWIMACLINGTTQWQSTHKCMRNHTQCVWTDKQQPNHCILPCSRRVPTKPTWLAAICKGFFATWPLLMERAVTKYFLESTSKTKGQMQQQRQGRRSMKPKNNTRNQQGFRKEQDT